MPLPSNVTSTFLSVQLSCPQNSFFYLFIKYVLEAYHMAYHMARHRLSQNFQASGTGNLEIVPGKERTLRLRLGTGASGKAFLATRSQARTDI